MGRKAYGNVASLGENSVLESVDRGWAVRLLAIWVAAIILTLRGVRVAVRSRSLLASFCSSSRLASLAGLTRIAHADLVGALVRLG